MNSFAMRRRLSSGLGLTYVLLILIMPSLVAAQESARAKAAACLAYAAVVRESPVLVTPAKPAPLGASESEPISYRDAYSLYKTQQRSMVVMVTASWCPYCPAMKRQLLQLKQDGKLPGVSLAIVDHDRDHAIARSVMGERRTLPALSVYQYVDGKATESRPKRASEISDILRPVQKIKAPLR